jgi:hypothetical protein
MCLQNLSRISITCVSFQQPMSPQGPSLCIQISTVSHTTNDSSNRIRVSQESSSNLTSSPSVSPSSSAPPHLPNSSSGASPVFPSHTPCHLTSVPQLRRRYRWHIRLRVLGPPRNRPHDIRRRRTRRHRQHRAPRFRPERRPPQQMDRRSPARTLKQRIATARRLG